jgi:Ycf66 protein N-terminus
MTAQILAQVNLGTNSASIIGMFYVSLSVVYLLFMIILFVKRASRLQSSTKVRYILQLAFIPFVLFSSGFILVFQGWRLDPILQAEQVLLFILVLYLIIKDIGMDISSRNR